MDKEYEKKVNQLYYELVKACAEKQFKKFVECAPQDIKSTIDKSERIKNLLFQVFLAGFHSGFTEFESMEELEKLEKAMREKLKTNNKK